MPLDDAMPFLSRNFDQFVEMMKKKIMAVNEWVPPDAKVSYLLNLLADGRQLSIPELEEIDSYVQSTLSKMRAIQEDGATSSKRSEKVAHKELFDFRQSEVKAEKSSLLPPPHSRSGLPPPAGKSKDCKYWIVSLGYQPVRV